MEQDAQTRDPEARRDSVLGLAALCHTAGVQPPSGASTPAAACAVEGSSPLPPFLVVLWFG